MKKALISFFTLLLFAVTATTATAQPKPKLAVLVVGMDDWMLGDVLAHLVGEDLNRGKNYDVVTRSNAVQNKLKALRRGYNSQADYLLRTWATEQGISTLCLVTTMPNLNFSLRLLDVSSGEVLCNVSRVDPNAVALKQLAWSLTGNLGSGCTPSGPLGDYTEPLIGMEMVYVEGDTFTMGCVSGRDNRNGHSCENNEKPPHSVSVGDFWIGRYEVTQAQWKAVMGNTIEEQRGAANYSVTAGEGDNYPMYFTSWYDARAFCAVLSASTGKSYRLATEAEWEYAARGGKLSRGYVYSGSNSIDSVAWYDDNCTYYTRIVGTTKKKGNELGICDMSGNLAEWCSDYWRSNYNASENTSYRVIRGGGFRSDALNCRVAYRSDLDPSDRDDYVGFRVV